MCSTCVEGFVRMDIGSFRYDKRGCGASEGRYYSASFHDLIDDACAAVDMLLRRLDVSAIIRLGHSERTIIAPIVSVRMPCIKSMILMCPTVDPIEKILMIKADRLAQAVKAMPGLRGGLLGSSSVSKAVCCKGSGN